MKVLITGCAGFVGSNVINQLSQIYDVTGIDDLSFGRAENVLPHIDWFEMGFQESSEHFYNTFDVVVHCACANIIYAQTEPIDTFKRNTLQSINLFNKFKGKIIYTSTASVYGQAAELPTSEEHVRDTYNAYDLSKLAAEIYLRQRGNYTTLRLSNVYGPNQHADNPYSGVIGKFIGQTLAGETVKIHGDGKDTRDFTHVDDVVRAIDMAIVAGPLNTEINISGGEETSINQLATYIAYLSGRKVDIEYVERRSIDKITRRWLDVSKARSLLGWEPSIKLKKGLIELIEK